jgi:hypothetical protein
LLDVLPESVLTVIAKHSFPDRWGYPREHPMFAVATSFRDAVFRVLVKIRLDPRIRRSAHPDLQAVARLLHRGCCEAASGLNLELEMDEQPEALPIILQPALSSGGWRKVHKLEVGALFSTVSCGAFQLLLLLMST